MAEKNKDVVGWIAIILLIIGGLNWGLEAFGYNVVSALFGEGVVTNVVYGLVGLSALYKLVLLLKKK